MAEILELFGVVLVSGIHRFLIAHLPDTIDPGDGYCMLGSQVIVGTSKILRNPHSHCILGFKCCIQSGGEAIGIPKAKLTWRLPPKIHDSATGN